MNYTYDARNEVTAVSWPNVPAQTTPASSSVTFGHTYDPTNRRMQQTATDNSWLLYPAATASTINYAANALNQYSAVGTATPSYDGNGNLAFDGTFTHCYDAESRLTGVLGSGSCASPGTTVATYAYDARGRRKTKTVGSTTTVFVTDADNREALEYDGTSGQVQRWYAYGLGIDEALNQMNVPAVTRLSFIPDIQGSVIATLDSGSGTLTKTGYLAYGENVANTSGTFRFTGRRLDGETGGSAAQPSGLYYYRARTYSPTWGRFLQTDPIGYAGGVNLCAYVNNDPLDNVDPNGNQSIPGVLIGAAAGGMSGYLAGYHNTSSIWGGLVGSLIGGAVGAATGTVASYASAQAGGGIVGALLYTGVNTGGGAGAAALTDIVQGNRAQLGEDVRNGALIGGLTPIGSGEAVLSGMLLGAERAGFGRASTLVESAITTNTAVLGVSASAGTTCSIGAGCGQAIANLPTTGPSRVPKRTYR